MRKKYILDTSALMDDPNCFRKFPKNEVIIPIVVLSELDKLKKQPGETGKQARTCIRLLDDITNEGDVSAGIHIKDIDTLLKIDSSYYNFDNKEFSGFGDPSYGDSQILACAYSYHKKYSKQAVLVSNDINLRLKAKSRKIPAIDHKEKSSAIEVYSGVKTIVNDAAGLELQSNLIVNPSKYDLRIYPNECVLFQGVDGKGISMGRMTHDDKISLIKQQFPWGLSSRNKEQVFAIDMLMDKGIDLVTMLGKAGSGKSLIAIACALELVLHRKAYDKLIIYRPIQPVGNDIGYLPGSLEEKLAPWFQAILDSFEFLFSGDKNSDWKKEGAKWKRDLEMFQNQGKIEMNAITYIRGRSIPNSVILIDEVQNITREEIKTILTRAGEGTKIILTGDVEQIDKNNLDATNNGLTYTIEKFKTSNIAGHVTFTAGERSRLATLASNIL